MIDLTDEAAELARVLAKPQFLTTTASAEKCTVQFTFTGPGKLDASWEVYEALVRFARAVNAEPPDAILTLDDGEEIEFRMDRGH